MKKTEYAKVKWVSGKTLEDFIANLRENVSRQVPEGVVPGNFELETEWDYGDSYYAVISFNYVREETPVEQETREAQEQRSLALQRAQYEALKKKFG
jgi:hypothetical protein